MHLPHVATSPSSHPHLPFSSNPKSYTPSLTGCLLAWILDKCQRSKRGLFDLSCYIRNLSLIHHSPFFRVLLCYYFLTISLSLSLSLIIGHLASLHLSLEQLCCYNLFPLGIKRALEESWSTGLGLGVPIYCEVKSFFESYCELLNSCFGKLVY
jgi:hypothetical protein